MYLDVSKGNGSARRALQSGRGKANFDGKVAQRRGPLRIT